MSINNLNCKLFHNFPFKFVLFYFFFMKINYSQLISNNLLANSSNNLLLLCVWLPLTNKKYERTKNIKKENWKVSSLESEIMKYNFKLWIMLVPLCSLQYTTCFAIVIFSHCSNIICFNVYFIIKHIIKAFIKLFAFYVFCAHIFDFILLSVK